MRKVLIINGLKDANKYALMPLRQLGHVSGMHKRSIIWHTTCVTGFSIQAQFHDIFNTDSMDELASQDVILRIFWQNICYIFVDDGSAAR